MCKTAGLDHTLAELDIGAAAGHIGGNRHCPGLTGSGHDLGLFLVVLGR